MLLLGNDCPDSLSCHNYIVLQWLLSISVCAPGSLRREKGRQKTERKGGRKETEVERARTQRGKEREREKESKLEGKERESKKQT